MLKLDVYRRKLDRELLRDDSFIEGGCSDHNRRRTLRFKIKFLERRLNLVWETALKKVMLDPFEIEWVGKRAAETHLDKMSASEIVARYRRPSEFLPQPL